jgi:hypothetical protein
MKIPCYECLVFPCCQKICKQFNNAMRYHGLNIDKLKPYIYSKNGHIRKHIPTHIIKHYNSHLESWNKGIDASDLIYGRSNES